MQTGFFMSQEEKFAIAAATDGACSGNPGPGLPLHAPSVAAVIANFCSLDIKKTGLLRPVLYKQITGVFPVTILF